MGRKLYFIKKTVRPLLKVAYFMAQIKKLNFLKNDLLKFDENEIL